MHAYNGTTFSHKRREAKAAICNNMDESWGPLLPCFSHVWLFATLWTIAHQDPLSRGFSRQECWSWLPFPPPEDLPNPGIEPMPLTSPVLAGGFFTTSAPGKPLEGIMLSEISHRKTNTIWSHCGIKKTKHQTHRNREYNGGCQGTRDEGNGDVLVKGTNFQLQYE